MDIAGLLQLAGDFGQMGLFVGYLIWRESRYEKRRAAEVAERNRLHEADIAAREKQAVAFNALATVIEGRWHGQ